MQWLRSLIQSEKVSDLSTSEKFWSPIGSGNLLGHEWSARAEADGVDRYVDLAWLEGFFSGASLAEAFTFLATENDLLNASRWMDERLARNPDEKASHAAAQLAAQLLDPDRSNPW